MALTKIRLGDYIERSTVNNNDLKYGEDLIVGVTNAGVFSHPKGDVSGVNLRPYKIVENGAFVYNPSRLDLGSIAYRTEGLCIVSHLYQIFYLNDAGKRVIDPMWLFMYFRRNEFYREVNFRNFGSQRSEFNLNDMGEIEINLPPIEIQARYADVYRAILANQQSYERGLEDLKQTCFAMADYFKHSKKNIPVGDLLEEIDVRNSDRICDRAQGINITKQFMPSVASSSDLLKYKLVYNNQFAYSAMQTGRDECIRIALYNGDKPIAVSPAYSVLQKKTDIILEEYIQMWFSRPESDRLGWFMSDASIRANLDLLRFYEIEIPVPDLDEQMSLVNIYNAYALRREINEQLKTQIRGICPVLIRGSLIEGK